MPKTRFAPSPTGYLHVGGLRTALYNYLYARKTDGDFVLRIEDTDQNRKVDGAVEGLLSTFSDIGLEFDEGPTQGGENGPYFQSERLGLYKEHVEQLLEAGHAYPCFCTPERLEEVRQARLEEKLNTPYDRHCLNIVPEEVKRRMESEPHIIRMRIPDDQDVVLYDLVRDEVRVHTSEIDDQVLVKSDGFPTYHLANVIDDHYMGVTHVIRGEEWLKSTPKHILLYRFFDWKQPKFAHLSLLLNPDRSKLSKRQGDVAVEDYLKKGYLPEALLNFVAMLGWSPGNDEELFNLDQLIKAFSLKGLQKPGAVFDVEKLNWFNGQYLRSLPIDVVAERARPYFEDGLIDPDNNGKYFEAVDDARQRVSTLAEIPEKSRMYYEKLSFTEEDMALITTENSRKVYQFWLMQLEADQDISPDRIQQLLKDTTGQTEIKGKELFWPLRIALYGSPHGPDLPRILKIIGPEMAIERLNTVLRLS